MANLGGVSNVPKLQPISALSVTAVQNTWYEVLPETVNCRVYWFVINMQTLAEDIEVRVTIDGNVITCTGSAVAAINNVVDWYFTAGGWALTLAGTTYKAYTFEGKKVKLEVRKTTNNGANTLLAKACYATW